MDRHTEAVDVYSILKPVFFVSKVLGLSPYIAVGDIGNRSITVMVSAIIYSLGMFILSVGVFAYFIIPSMFLWENICSFSENILCLGTVCHAVSAYCTCVLGCRQTARQFGKLNDLIGTTCYSAWRKDLRLLLAMQILNVSMIFTAAVLEISEAISQFYDFLTVPTLMLYYVTDLVGFMSDHQFVALMHILKHTVQKWNNHIDVDCENDDVINSPLYRNEMNGQKSVLFTVSNKSVISKLEKVQSKVVHFKQLKELHASLCDIAESVNAVYSPLLLLSVAKLFTSLTHVSYDIVLRFIAYKATSFCKFTGNNSYFIWLIIFTLRLIWLVYFTAFTAKEVSHNVQHFNYLHNYLSSNVKLVSVPGDCLPCIALQIVFIFQLQQDVAFRC
jgi:hypothetical protein